MTYETYRYIFVIAAVLCGVMFGVSVLLFFLLKIPAVIGNLSGSTARKSIRTIEEKSSWKENGTNDPNENWKSRGRLTDKNITVRKSAAFAAHDRTNGHYYH